MRMNYFKKRLATVKFFGTEDVKSFVVSKPYIEYKISEDGVQFEYKSSSLQY